MRMFLNVLSDKQLQLLPFLAGLKREFILVGDTAIALQIGYRKSMDFDLFKVKNFQKRTIKQKIARASFPKLLLFENTEGIHYLVNDVKITFFHYPFPIQGVVSINHYLKMPDLLTLAAMKFYAMGCIAKWKDYVDF